MTEMKKQVDEIDAYIKAKPNFPIIITALHDWKDCEPYFKYYERDTANSSPDFSGYDKVDDTNKRQRCRRILEILKKY